MLSGKWLLKAQIFKGNYEAKLEVRVGVERGEEVVVGFMPTTFHGRSGLRDCKVPMYVASTCFQYGMECINTLVYDIFLATQLPLQWAMKLSY